MACTDTNKTVYVKNNYVTTGLLVIANFLK